MRWLWAVVLLFSGCVASHVQHTNGVRFDDSGNVVRWRQQNFPLSISHDDSLDDADILALHAAVRSWNRAIGTPVFRTMDEHWGAVHVRQHFLDNPSPNLILQGLAWREYTDANYTRCVITLNSETEDFETEIVLLHELGHALGLEHDSWRESIMYSNAVASGGRIMQDDIQFIRWQVNGE